MRAADERGHGGAHGQSQTGSRDETRRSHSVFAINHIHRLVCVGRDFKDKNLT